MRILVPIEDLEPVATKTWPAPRTQPQPPAPPPAPVQPKKPPPPSQRPAPRPSAPKRQPIPAHPTAAVAKTTIDKRARVTDVSSGTGYDIATGARLAEAKVASTMPTGMKFLASAPLPINADVRSAPSAHRHPHVDIPSLKTVSEALTYITIIAEVAALYPPVAVVAVPIAEGAQFANTGIEIYELKRHPSAEGVAVVVADTALLGAGRAARKVPALSTRQGKQAERVAFLSADLSLFVGTHVEKAQPEERQPYRPSLRPGR